MTRKSFFKAADQCGLEIAEYAAKACGIKLAIVQLWAIQWLTH